MGLLFYFIAQKNLALEPSAQCHAQGDNNVAQEIQLDLLLGRTLIGGGQLNVAEETAIADLAEAAHALPCHALASAIGHAANVAVLRNPVWEPLRLAAAKLILLLERRTSQIPQ